jgi:hypothetical protein
MEGKPDPPSLRGVIPNSFQHIFDYVSNSHDVQYLVRASYLEIYNEEIRDLLSKDPKNSLELKENVDSGVYVKDLTSFVVKNVAGKRTDVLFIFILSFVPFYRLRLSYLFSLLSSLFVVSCLNSSNLLHCLFLLFVAWFLLGLPTFVLRNRSCDASWKKESFSW